MTSLDEYLSGEFADFDRERKQIDEIIIKTIAALEGSFRKNRGWPYELSVAPNAHPNWPVRPSISTAAMIGAALAAASGRTEGALLSSNVAWRPETKRKEAADRASLKVARNALNLIFQSARLENESFTFYSGTFGADDVLTLCWLVDLHEALAGLAPTAAPTEAQAHENDGGAKSLAEVIERIFHRRTELHASDPAHIVRKLFRIEKTRGGSKQIELLGSEHAFPLLRTLQIKQWARRRVNDTLARIPSLPFVAAYDAGRWQDEFSRRVHEQLSFYAIPDSRFDPAELAFALEGLSLARPASLDRAVIKRAFRVLLEEQCRNPTLRPARPIKSDPTGKTLFPVSVEIFNSLLRTAAQVAAQFGSAFVRSDLIELTRRYYSWVRPRLVVGESEDAVFGWHSEHINDPSLVHPWETSQILLFLLGYRTVVDEHLATGSLNAAGLSIREPRSVRAGHGISGRARPSPEQMTVRWSELIDEREPVSSPSGDDGPDLAILAAIGRDFVRDHANGKAANYSMVLYGPPGTGKTGIAEELADTLDWPLITITVSDFLAEGGLQIEARAKGVFAVLTAQKNTVIIFDEIDHLLLNRNSEQYADVDSSIQLMVPGMLTKIKDLRSAERSIFIIATNYAERIDSAITRPGRIDRKYLVMPPDWGRRKAIVEGLLKGYSEKTREIPGEIITRVTNSPELLKGTARMSYGEIRAVLYDLLSTRLTGDELVNRVRAFTYPDPVADLESYESRKPKTRELKQEELALRVIDREARKQGAEPRATSTRRPSAPPRRSRRPSRKDGGVK